MQRMIGRLLKPIASQDAAHGALPTLFAATASQAELGGYYGPHRMTQMKGHPVSVPIAKASKEATTSAMLWNATEKLIGIRFDLGPQ
jgi:hypothetical protein